MVQDEVWQKLRFDAEKKSYLYWILNYAYEVQYLKTVPAKAFSPAPKVKSCLIWLVKKGKLPNIKFNELIKFLDSIDFENLIIIWDFIDYRQLRRFWKRTEKEQKTLNYINNLAKNWINITYIQWNHDRELKCWDKIHTTYIGKITEIYFFINFTTFFSFIFCYTLNCPFV